MKKVLKFWGRVLWRALRDTFRPLFERVLKSLGWYVSLAFVFAWCFYKWGPEPLAARANFWLVTLAASGVLLVMTFHKNLIVAPLRIAEDDEKNLASKVEGLEKQVASLNEAVALQTAEREKTTTELRSELERVRNSDLARNAIRRQVAFYIEQYETVAAKACDGTASLVEISRVDQSSRKYLAANLPQYGLYDTVDGLKVEIPDSVPQETQQLYIRAHMRIARLREVLSML